MVQLPFPRTKTKKNGAAKRTWDADLRFAICSGIRDTSAKDM